MLVPWVKRLLSKRTRKKRKGRRSKGKNRDREERVISSLKLQRNTVMSTCFIYNDNDHDNDNEKKM